MIRISVLIVLAAWAGAPAAAVFRWVDADGQVHYSDTPDRDAEQIEIESRPTDPERVRAREQQAAALRAERQLRAGQQAEDAAAQAGDAERIAAERAANCESARQRLATYETAHRLYRPLADGEREYLSDEELDAARTEARLSVEEWCG
jgi:hypothetical protein